MNWYKYSQLDPLVQQYNTLLEHSPTNIRITGSGTSQSISLPGSKTILARDLLQQAVDRIKPILLQHNVKEIDTSPISQANAIGLAISHQPGRIHIDLSKIFNAIRHQLPPIAQLDGMTTDPDTLNTYVNRVSAIILGELGEVISHEGKHNLQFGEAFQSGKPFTSVTERPAEQFGQKTRKQYFPQTFHQ